MLHDFFKPDKDWSDLQLLQHRDAITEQRPSLPHQAGRTLARFWETTAQVGLQRVQAAKQPAGSGKRVRQTDRHITVKALARPEIDAHQLARAFIHLARDFEKTRLAEEDQSAPD